MRYSREHKAEVRQKIVKDASRRLRSEGMSGAAIASVMRDTGLTHGGFYKHFDNKDELLLESLHEAFHDIEETLIDVANRAGSEGPHSEPWKAIVSAYLSPEYCDRPDRGCPMTALAPDLARVHKSVRGRFFSELANYKDHMAPFMPGRRTADKERAFFLIFSTMIGTIQIARMLPPALRERVLTSARDFLFHSFQ